MKIETKNALNMELYERASCSKFWPLESLSVYILLSKQNGLYIYIVDNSYHSKK